MSSPAFRQALLAEMANWTATPWFDLSEYVSIDDIPADSGTPVVLVQFVGGNDRIATIAQPGNHGWREQGVGYFHLLMPTGESSARALQLGEQLRSMFRGRRFGPNVIDMVEPFSNFAGAAIRVQGKWTGWSAGFSYYTVTCA